MTPRQLIEPARLAGNALLHTQSDERLVDLTRAGNDRAFEVIVGRYRSPLLRYCERLLPAGRAEDAVQQAFLNAYRAIGSNEAELKLKPWLYRVAHNASLNLLRQNGWDYDEIPEDFDGVVQPPQALEQRERIREVVRAVQDLPERQRGAIVLRELEGRSYEEIAAAIGVTDGAVRQLLNRARGTLRATATALTPPRLLESLIDKASSPTASQIAEVSAGAGGAAGVLKLGAALFVAGAVGGAVVAGPAHHLVLGGASGRARAAEALAVTPSGGGGGHTSLGGPTALGLGTGPVQGHGEGSPVGPSGSGDPSLATGPSSQTGGGSGSGSGPGGGPGPGGGGQGGFADFNPGSGGGGDHSGPGGGGGGDHSGDGGGVGGDGGHSGPGGGSDGGSSGGGSSGPGSGSSGPDGGSSGTGDSTSGFGSGLPTVDSSGPGGGGTSGSGSGDGGGGTSDGGGLSGSDSGSASSDGGHSGPG